MEENKRYFFRVPITNAEVTIKGEVSNIEIKGNIRDISALGISFYKTTKNELIKHEKVKIVFKLENQTFERRGIFVREMKIKNDDMFAYKFIGNTEKENSTLSSLLFKLDAKRRK